MATMSYRAAICMMEGCEFHGGSTCTNCKRHLRCPACGQFVREETLDGHLKDCKIAKRKWGAATPEVGEWEPCPGNRCVGGLVTYFDIDLEKERSVVCWQCDGTGRATPEGGQE